MKTRQGPEPEDWAYRYVLDWLQTFDPQARLDTPLADLVLDSLDVVEFLMRSEEERRIEIPPKGVLPRTGRDLADLLRSAHQS